MQRIGINAHLLSAESGYRRAGIHQYIYQTLRHLPPMPGVERIIYHGPQSRPLLSAIGRLRAAPWHTEKPAARIAWEQALLPIAVRRDRLDLLHATAFATPRLSRVPAVVTVFDLSFEHYPDRFPRAQRLYLQRETRRSCRAARRIIVISQSSADDVAQRYGVDPSRIDIIYPGVNPIYTPLPAAEVDAFRRREQLPERFILHVGTLQPRKNIERLLEALAQMNRPDLHLCLVGGKGWLYDSIYERARRLGISDRTHLVGYVPDEALPLWYNAAAALAFPSVYEGFGLPVVEALACGTPVAASDVSSLPEAVGDAGLLFAPHSAASIAHALTTLLDDRSLRNSLRQRGLVQARRFSWQQAGHALANVYRRALPPR